MGQLAIGIGDLGLAYQAFKIAVSVDMNHAESFNNLGVLELRKHNPDAARSNFEGSHKLSEFHFGTIAQITTPVFLQADVGKPRQGTACFWRGAATNFLLLLRHVASCRLRRTSVQRRATIV